MGGFGQVLDGDGCAEIVVYIIENRYQSLRVADIFEIGELGL